MTEKARTTLFGILKLIPFAIVTAMIVLLWVDDFLCFILSFFCFWITLPAILLSIVSFIKGVRWRDIWQRIAVVWGGLNLLMLILYFLVQEPNQRCDPEWLHIMRSITPKWKRFTDTFNPPSPTVVGLHWNSREIDLRCFM